MSEDIKAGVYKGRAVPGSEKFGTSTNGTEQCSFAIVLPELGRTVVTILSFSAAAMPFALERLKACGWSSGDTNFAKIGDNEIQVNIKYEEYKGEKKMKAEILSGGGFAFQNPMAQGAVSRLFAAINQADKASGGTNGQAAAAKPKNAKDVLGDDEFPT